MKHDFSRSSIFLGICLLIALSGLRMIAEETSNTPAAATPNESAPEKHEATESTDIPTQTAEPAPKVKTTEEKTLEEISTFHWEPLEDNRSLLSFEEVLKMTESQNQVQISQEKIVETKAKEKKIKNQRLLFFFKFFNAGYLENSAESDVQAAGEHKKMVLQKALLESAEKYYNLMEALMTKYTASEAIKQGLKQLEVNRSRFVSGETTNFDVLQTQTQLLKRYQDFLVTDHAYKATALILSEHLDMSPKESLYPSDLMFEEGAFVISVLGLVSPNLDVNEAVQTALQNRPDLKELRYQRASLQNLVKASSFDLDKSQQAILESTFKQADLRVAKMERAVEAATRVACDDFLLSRKNVSLAKQQLDLADKTLAQAMTSHQAGFSSNKDVLDAQITQSQAQVNFIKAQIAYNLRQIQLLYEMGVIDVNQLLGKNTKV